MKGLLNFVLILSVLIFITILITRKMNVEQFRDYDQQDSRFEIYNQNYDKVWKIPYQSGNYPKVPQYPTSFNDLYKLNQYKFNTFPNRIVNYIAEIISNGITNKDVVNDLLYAKKKITEIELIAINKSLWTNRWNEIDPNKNLYLKYTKSKINEVNITNTNFLAKFNQIFFDFIDDYDKRELIIYKPFFIVKYKIVNVYENKTNFIYQITTVVTRDNTQLAFEFLITSYFSKSKKEHFEKMQVNYIGNYSLDQVIFPPGLDKYNDVNYNLNSLYQNDHTMTDVQVNKALEKSKIITEKNRDRIDNSYACFAYNKFSKNPVQRNIFAVNKNDCENSYDIIGYKKPYGVWDKPCKKNSECIFYKSNKNYKNDFGLCKNGKCELPINMQNLGYHYYINEKSTRPLCYNCNSKKWLPKTELGFCCEEQQQDIRGAHKKYPFLNSPDYAFDFDDQQRYNSFLQKDCKSYNVYNNIFSNTPTNSKVVCKDSFNYFIPK
jgi:hypothetical protein